ncbi:MAG TPA: 4-hydroxyphenylacetate 3-hydroxylase N-terminal domain-containing protein [Thermodesulfobacteriota bacterium]|nr:4-hydroxyphenylacetate 3-hydroxylase N-terminal domain-containing protein [Thermodesulfobacteriota bacterium]
MRTGQAYLESLRDGRRVYLDGEAVADVATHPAFAAPAREIARLYDLAADPAHAAAATFRDPESGAARNAIWLIPRSRDDLEARRRVHELWQEATFGLMGRSPDHVASFLTGFAASLDLFARGGRQFADNVWRFYRKASAEDLYLAYAIVPPQGDRSKPAHQQEDRHFYAGVVKERDGGIVLRGAQGIGTAAALADYVFVSSIVPLRPGDEDYAISVVIPLNAPGLKIYPRRPYATIGGSLYDYPLSSRFDETDALVVLDDVFVPWEQVFVYRNVELVQAQFFEGPAHVLGNFQALVRLSVKLRFLLGLAKRICEAHGTDALPPVQSQLGELAAHAAVVEALVRAAAQAPVVRGGVAWPDVEAVYAGLVLQPAICEAMLRTLRELAGGGLIALPSSAAMFTSEATAADVRRYFRSGALSAEERVKLLKLAWDLVGTEFGGRQLQYELFYAGAPFIVRHRTYRAHDWRRATRLVDRCLAGYALPGAARGEGSHGGG